MHQTGQRNSARPELSLPVTVVLQEGKAIHLVSCPLVSAFYFVLFRGLRIVLLGVAIAQGGCWEGITRNALATVLSTEGTTVIRPSGRGQSSPLLPGAHPGGGAIIQTSASSRAALEILPNILLQLDHDTGIEIVRIEVTKDGNETGNDMRARHAAVRLLAGRAFVSHVWGEASSGFTVVTPHGELVTNSNSLYCVESDEHKTRVTCVTGTVRFQPSDGSAAMAIRGGFLAEWPSPTPGVIAAETDARAQEDLQETLDAERNLRRLISKNP